MSRRRGAVAITTAGVAALVLAACNGGEADADGDGGATGQDAAAGEEVTITWWHNSNNDPGRSYYEQVAEDFMADNPGVTIDITAIAHDDMLTPLAPAFQTGAHPDIFQERRCGEADAPAAAALHADQHGRA